MSVRKCTSALRDMQFFSCEYEFSTSVQVCARLLTIEVTKCLAGVFDVPGKDFLPGCRGGIPDNRVEDEFRFELS